MFKLVKLAPMLWMAWRWYQGQKKGAALKGSTGYSKFDRRR